jgi:signal transduction histidine kinase
VTLRPRSLAVTAALAGGLFTLVVTVVPSLHFAYRSPSLHIVLETAAGLIALLAAYLMLGRFAEDGRLRDLALTSALAFFGVANLFFSALPAALADAPPGRFSTWAPLAAQLIGTVVYAFAAFAPARRTALRARSACLLAIAHLAVVAAIAGAVTALEPWLPTGIDPALSPEGLGRPYLAGHPVVHGVQAVQLLLFAAAAVGFGRTSRVARDGLVQWLAAGAVLAAFARLNYFLFPSLFSEWVYTGDVLRTAFYLILLVGAAHEIRKYWKQVARSTVLDERRRIARELHDGVAQELAFVLVQSRRLANDQPGLEPIVAAAERALDESRRAMAALTRPLDEPLVAVLADEAEEIAARVGLDLELDLCDGVEVTPAEREALLRVVREAVTSAARYGGATSTRIELSRTGRACLRISDDARDHDLGTDGSFGGSWLRIAGERTRALGGKVRIESVPGVGTEIEVMLP